MKFTRNLRRLQAARPGWGFLNLALLMLAATVALSGVYQTENFCQWSGAAKTLNGHSRLASGAFAPLAVLPRTVNPIAGEALRRVGNAQRPRVVALPLALLPEQVRQPLRLETADFVSFAVVVPPPVTTRVFDSRGPPVAA
jgi:hypothetical protein